MNDILGIIGTITGLIYGLVKGRQAERLQRENKKLLSRIKKLQEEQRKSTMEIKEGIVEIKGMIDGFAENTPSDEPLKGKIEEADSLFHEGRFKEAYKLHNEINKKALSLGKDKLFVLSMIGKGISIGMLKDYKGAIGILKSAEAYKDFLDDNAKGKLYLNLGYCNQMLKNNALAIEYYSKSLNANPNIADVYNNRGIAYDAEGEHKRAIRDYDKAINLDPGLIPAYNNRGIVYAEKGEHERAIRDFAKAIELKPEYDRAYYNMGIAYDDKEEYERAIKLYKKFLGFATDKEKEQIAHAKKRIKELQKEIDKNNQ
jgi:tetratricopeptide (TPR) repeat protein